MKRILNLFLVLLMGLVLVGLGTKEVGAEGEWDYQETFDNAELTSSYSDGSFIGVGGITWTYVQSRDENNDTNKSGIDGNAIMLRRSSDDSAIKSSIITGGISYFEVKLYKGFTGNGDRQVEVFINGVSVGESEGFNDYDEHVFIIENLEISGDFTIEIKNITSTQVIIDDITWKSFEEVPLGVVRQLFSDGNSNDVTLDEEFGQDVNVPVENRGNDLFQFAVVNGVIRDGFVVGEDYTLPITEGLEVSLVYATEETHAVLFLDSNGKLISNTWVNDGANVTAPDITELSKPGYKLSETPWLSNEDDTSLNNITSSRVYTLQYELEETNIINITVGETTTEYNYNEIVTLTKTNPNFKAWLDEEGNVLSTKPVYSFTALTNKTIVESTDEPTTLPVVTMTNDLTLRSEYQTFVGQLELRDGDTLVEYGLVASEDVLLSKEELTLDNAEKLRSYILAPVTNEFMLSIPTDYVVVRAYVTVRNSDNEIKTLYSDNQYNDVAFVMLAQEDLTIDGVATIDGLDLPLSGLHNTTITWISNNPAVITNDGDVTLPEEETIVIMTATIKSGNVEVTKKFEVTVLPEGQEPEPEIFTAVIKAPEGSSAGVINTVTASDMNLDENIFSVIFTDSSSNAGYYVGNPLRFYAGTNHVITINENYVITSIVIGGVSREGGNLIIGTESTKIITNLAKSNLNINSFTIDAKSQTRITEITITYRAK